MPTKLEVIAEYQKLVTACDKNLNKKKLPEAVRDTLKTNKQKAQDWISFLQRPDTPELGW